MATLIAAYDSSGCVGRCDAKCYNATSHHCDCICGGANHGAGLQQALENTREMVEEWIDAYKKTNPEAERFELGDDVKQPSLFEKVGWV